MSERKKEKGNATKGTTELQTFVCELNFLDFFFFAFFSKSFSNLIKPRQDAIYAGSPDTIRHLSATYLNFSKKVCLYNLKNCKQ